jgi:hypothetical protein
MTSGTFAAAVLVIAVVVTGLSFAQAFREDSLEPILRIGWLPAILVGAFYRKSSAGRSCSDRLLRRSRA